MTHLSDLSVQFLDLSCQLLHSTGPETPLAASYPSPIPRLTIELAPLLLDPTLGLVDPTVYDPHLAKQRIDAVYFAPESLECVTILRSGAVILHRLDVPPDATTFGQQTLEDKELVSLSHLRVRKGLRYSPLFAIKPDKGRGRVTSCALSDVGFLAVAYASGLLLVIDLRIPRVILRSATRPEGSGFFHRHAEAEPIETMIWACCGLSTGECGLIPVDIMLRLSLALRQIRKCGCASSARLRPGTRVSTPSSTPSPAPGRSCQILL